MARRQSGCGSFTILVCAAALFVVYSGLTSSDSNRDGHTSTIRKDDVGANITQTTSAASIELLQNQLSDIGVNADSTYTTAEMLLECGIGDLVGIKRENDSDDGFAAFSLKLTQDRKANILTVDNEVFYVGVNGHDLYTDRDGLSGKTVDDCIAYVDDDGKDIIRDATISAIKSIVKYPDTVDTGAGYWTINRDGENYEVIVTASYENAIGEFIGDYYLVELTEKSGCLEFVKATSQGDEEKRLASIVGEELAKKTISFFDYSANYFGRYTPLRFINQQSDLASLFISSGMSSGEAYDSSCKLVKKCFSFASAVGMKEPCVFMRVIESYRTNDFSSLEAIRFNYQ